VWLIEKPAFFVVFLKQSPLIRPIHPSRFRDPSLIISTILIKIQFFLRKEDENPVFWFNFVCFWLSKYEYETLCWNQPDYNNHRAWTIRWTEICDQICSCAVGDPDNRRVFPQRNGGEYNLLFYLLKFCKIFICYFYFFIIIISKPPQPPTNKQTNTTNKNKTNVKLMKKLMHLAEKISRSLTKVSF